jgi:hypothetical protein
MSRELTSEDNMIANFEKLPFERKVDVLVDLHVIGNKELIIEVLESILYENGVYYRCIRDGSFELIPCYSTLLTSAWDLVRKFDYCYLFRSKDFKGGQWECKLADKHSKKDNYSENVLYAWAETEMLAICYAGLKAVGYPLKDFLKEEGDKG